MSSRVSVIVRTKDRPYFLARALADIAAQGHDELDVLVVNDQGDEDAARAVVASSPLADRTRVLATSSPGGRCAAANRGVRAATADYVVLHDDDDLWHPDFLASTVAYLDAHPMEAGVVVPTEIIYERAADGGWLEQRREPFWPGLSSVTFTELLEINRAVPISVLYRRAIHDDVGYYDESLETVEDWDFYLRLTARHSLGFLAGPPLAYWTQRPTARGSDGNSMFELAGAHERDDLAVRDAALRAWVERNGAGMPLFIASVERRLRESFARELAEQLDRQREVLVREIWDRHPVWRRVRRILRRR